MPKLLELKEVISDIGQLQTYWYPRNNKFKEWYKILWMIDKLAARGMESYVSNEPVTFYNMSHYLLTKGELSHSTPIESESVQELDIRARVHRGCQYMWAQIDRERQLGGNQPYVDELASYLLALGWYSTVLSFDKSTGLMKAQIWNPADTFPKYGNNRLISCVHSYKITEEEAILKAEENGWNYNPKWRTSAQITLDDYFYNDGTNFYNMVLLDKQDVTGWVERPEMTLLVAPVGGFPDKGSITPQGSDWRKLAGRGIFEATATVTEAFNKWKSIISQVLRDTGQPVTEEFSATPQATPEQLRERGALFHYAPGEQGLVRLPPAAIPIEIQANLLELRREMQKGSFNDAVYGMVEGQPGYALSLLATSSANQILYPYMDAKHFIISEADRFWLTNLKTSKRVFNIKGKFVEKLHPTDIPEDVTVIVESDVATPKDWLERGTIGGMLRQDVDRATLLGEVYKFPDPQAIIRRKDLDEVLDHPVSKMIKMISGYYAHAEYLRSRGDRRQADLFIEAAQALEAQLGTPPAGQGKPAEMTQIEAAREAGTPAPRATVSSGVAPPEAIGGFTPQELRRTIGQGRIR